MGRPSAKRLIFIKLKSPALKRVLNGVPTALLNSIIFHYCKCIQLHNAPLANYNPRRCHDDATQNYQGFSYYDSYYSHKKKENVKSTVWAKTPGDF